MSSYSSLLYNWSLSTGSHSNRTTEFGGYKLASNTTSLFIVTFTFLLKAFLYICSMRRCVVLPVVHLLGPFEMYFLLEHICRAFSITNQLPLSLPPCRHAGFYHGGENFLNLLRHYPCMHAGFHNGGEFFLFWWATVGNFGYFKHSLTKLKFIS